MQSGIKKLEYSTDGSTYVDLGQPLTGGSFDAGIQEVETAGGVMKYAGQKKVEEFDIPDMTKFSALETIMKADTPIYVKKTFMDNTTDVTFSNATVQVKKNFGFQVGQLNSFHMKVQEFTV